MLCVFTETFSDIIHSDSDTHYSVELSRRFVQSPIQTESDVEKQPLLLVDSAAHTRRDRKTEKAILAVLIARHNAGNGTLSIRSSQIFHGEKRALKGGTCFVHGGSFRLGEHKAHCLLKRENPTSEHFSRTKTHLFQLFLQVHGAVCLKRKKIIQYFSIKNQPSHAIW